MATTQQEDYQQGMQLLAETSALLEGITDEHAAARAQMIAQNLSTSQAIFNQLSVTTEPVKIYVDQAATGDNSGTSAKNAFTSLKSVFSVIPTNSTVIIYLAKGQVFSFDNPELEGAILYNVDVVFSHYSNGDASEVKPKISVPVIESGTTYAYSAYRVWLAGKSRFRFDYVDFEYTGSTARGFHYSTAFLCSFYGAELTFLAKGSDITLRNSEYLIGNDSALPYSIINILLVGAKIYGEGDLCFNLDGTVATFSQANTHIDAASFIFHHSWSDKRNMQTHYDGAQLSRHTQ